MFSSVTEKYIEIITEAKKPPFLMFGPHVLLQRKRDDLTTVPFSTYLGSGLPSKIFINQIRQFVNLGFIFHTVTYYRKYRPGAFQKSTGRFIYGRDPDGKSIVYDGRVEYPLNEAEILWEDGSKLRVQEAFNKFNKDPELFKINDELFLRELFKVCSNDLNTYDKWDKVSPLDLTEPFRWTGWYIKGVTGKPLEYIPFNLGKVTRFSLVNSTITSLPKGLPKSVSYFEIYNCAYLEDLSSLPPVNILDIELCPRITRDVLLKYSVGSKVRDYIRFGGETVSPLVYNKEYIDAINKANQETGINTNF